MSRAKNPFEKLIIASATIIGGAIIIKAATEFSKAIAPSIEYYVQKLTLNWPRLPEDKPQDNTREL